MTIGTQEEEEQHAFEYLNKISIKNFGTFCYSSCCQITYDFFDAQNVIKLNKIFDFDSFF